MENFADAINNVLKQNQNENVDFRPEKIGQKRPFNGRILPIDATSFPFATYEEVWLSYTNKNGDTNPVAAIINTKDPNDKLGALIKEIVSFNRQYGSQHNMKEDAIKVGAGKYNLRISKRATFIGVEIVKNNSGSWVQATNPEGQPDIKAYDISNGALTAIVEKLKPEFPYAFNGQPMFNNEFQFITTGQTFPINLKFNPSQTGIGNWSAEVIQSIVLPQITFNYLEKDETGNFKYIDDFFNLRQPMYITNPNFANVLFDQVNTSFQTQKAQLGQGSPYANNSNDDLPFPEFDNTKDVVQGMTGQPANTFTQPVNNAPQNTQPVQQAPMNNNNPVPPVQQPAPTQPINQPVSTPQTTVAASEVPQKQDSPAQQPTSTQNNDVEGLLNGTTSLEDFLSDN